MKEINKNREKIIEGYGKRIREDIGEGNITEKQIQQWYNEHKVYVSKTGLKHMLKFLNKSNSDENV